MFVTGGELFQEGDRWRKLMVHIGGNRQLLLQRRLVIVILALISDCYFGSDR